MEEQIKKLVELAKEYAKFMSDIPCETHAWLRKSLGEKDGISVYFTSDREFSVNFSEVTIAEYTEKITMPYKYNSADLDRIYNDAKEFLDTRKDEFIAKTNETRKQRINELKRELETLTHEE